MAQNTLHLYLPRSQSAWNEASLFTGWADVELTTLGKNEAAKGATQLWSDGYKIDVAYFVAQTQQALALRASDYWSEDVPVHCNWRLNERMYGGLTGLNKPGRKVRSGPSQDLAQELRHSTAAY